MVTLADQIGSADPVVRELGLREIVAFARGDESDKREDDEAFGEAIAEQGEELIALLADPVREIRALAAEAFAELARCDWEYDPVAAWQCTEDLIRLARAALQPLLELRRDPDPRVRSAVVGAIHHTWRHVPLTDARRDVLIEALADPVGAIRAAAIKGLIERIERQAEPLVTPLADDPAPEVRAVIATALVRVRSPRARDVALAEVRRAGAAASHEQVWRLSELELSRDEARELLAPLLGTDTSPDARRSATSTVVKYVDAWWNPLLARLVDRPDDPAWSAAVTALARLGPAAASDGLARYLDEPRVYEAGWAAAACERMDDFPIIQRALARVRRRPYNVPAAEAELDSPWHLINIASAFAHPNLWDACARFVVAPPGPVPGSRPYNAAAYAYGQQMYELSAGALAVGASGRRDGIALIRTAVAALPPDPERPALTVTRAALGIALIDPDALDAAMAGSASGRWLPRIATFEPQALGIAFALRLLGRRLRARIAPLPDPARTFVGHALRFVELALAEAPSDSWHFVIRDLLAEASPDLERALG